MPKISVIVPIYKVEAYLCRCIDSVLNQTFGDFECILVDDESPDNCPKICDEYAQKDERIKVIHKQNGGLSDARNKGLDIATGEYVFFLDSDDWIHPKTLEITHRIITDENSDMLSFAFEKVKEYSSDFTEYDINNITPETFETEYVFDNMFNRFQRYIGVEACKKLYKREIFENLRFTEGIIHEDDDIFFELVAHTKRISIIDTVLYFYYMSPSSIMREELSEKEFVRFEIDMKNVRFINQHNIKSQKKLCSLRYLGNFMYNYYLTSKTDKRLFALIKKHKFEYMKNVWYFIKNGNLSLLFLFIAMLFAISPKLAKPLFWHFL